VIFTRSRRLTFAKHSTTRKYPNETVELVQRLLRETEVPRDALPYTDEFVRLKGHFEAALKSKISTTSG
jgi:hypothetical protein